MGKKRIEDFKITSAIARSFAEQAWGCGGTAAYKTSRKGAYYFSCSGHGGYIVDSQALTAEERERIEKYIKPQQCEVWYQNGFVLGYRGPDNFKTKKLVRVRDGAILEHKLYPFYVFEEDCAWSILEKFTDVRCPGSRSPTTPKEQQVMIEECYRKYFFDNLWKVKEV